MEKIELVSNQFIVVFTINDENTIFISHAGMHCNYICRPSPLVEIETNLSNHLGSHTYKLTNSEFGKYAKYVSHKFINDKTLVIVLRDNFIEAEITYQVYDDINGYSCLSKITNISNDYFVIESISSIYLYGLGQNDNPCYQDMNIYYSYNSWCNEARWKKETFADAGILNANDRLSMSRFVLSNTGSWSTKEFLPMLAIENSRKKQCILTQARNNGSWHIEVGDNENSYYLNVGGPNFFNNQWAKKLGPNMSFETCKADIVFGADYEDSIQQLTKLRRHISIKDKDYDIQPVIFNDFMHGTWDLSKESDLLSLIDIASEVGVDTFVLDAGWFYHTSGWGNKLGDYKECSSNYPKYGLKGLFDYIRNKNMQTGLWFEIENVGIDSDIAKTLSEDCFMHIDNKRIVVNSRYILNLVNEEAFNHCYNTISNFIELYKLDYIKLDYNLDLGPGNTDYSNYIGEGLLEHNRAVISLVDKLKKKYPNLTIENCASGGLRLDYLTISHSDLISSSDLENPYKYPYISGNILTACLPSQAGIWSYPVCNDNQKVEIDDELVSFTMANSLLGRMQLSSKIHLLSSSQIDLVKEAIKLEHSLCEFKKNALPIWPNGLNKFDGDTVAAGLIDERRIILVVFNCKIGNKCINIKLDKYNVKNIKPIYPSSLKTDYNYNSNCLTVNTDGKLISRVFEITLNN